MYNNRDHARAEEMCIKALDNYRLPDVFVKFYEQLLKVIKVMANDADRADKIENMAKAKVVAYKYTLQEDGDVQVDAKAQIERKVVTWERVVERAKTMHNASDAAKEELFKQVIQLTADDALAEPGEKKDSLDSRRELGHARHSSA